MALRGRDCYTAAKGGIAAMPRSMAVEYAPHRIRVNAIAPSVTLTGRVERLLAESREIERISQTLLLGLGQPIHIADMAVYLAADESAITTGRSCRWTAASRLSEQSDKSVLPWAGPGHFCA